MEVVYSGDPRKKCGVGRANQREIGKAKMRVCFLQACRHSRLESTGTSEREKLGDACMKGPPHE